MREKKENYNQELNVLKILGIPGISNFRHYFLGVFNFRHLLI